MAKDTDNVGFNRDEYTAALPLWQIVDNVINAENLDSFLVELYPDDTSSENKQRNADYKARASWTGTSSFTLAGLIGTAYANDPNITKPAAMDYMDLNVDGSNVGLVQQMQSATREVLKSGRAGLFVTYPDTGGEPVSVADMENMKFVATVHKIDAKRIVNWSEMKVGAETIPSQVVFTDVIVAAGKFSKESQPSRRELLLEQNGESLRLVDMTWVKNKKDEWELVQGKTAYPMKGDGTAWNRIPFTFIGAVDNNSQIDKAPMYSICTKNRDYYRNSADNEESVWFCGQAQPWASGLSISVAKEMKDAGLYVGARKMLGLPEGSSFGYAVAPSNTMVRQAMIDKKEEMAELGARMIKQGTVAKTATQAAGENLVQHSILSLAYSNVAQAYDLALGWAAEYMNITAETSVEADKGFMNTPVTAQDIAAFKDLVMLGEIPPSDRHRFYGKNGLIGPDKSFEDWQEERDADNSALEGEE